MVKGVDGNIKSMKNEKEKSYIQSRQCHVGEQNIIHNKTYYDKSTHKLVHEVVIKDAELAPMSTSEALKDHIGEFSSAGVGKYTINLKSIKGSFDKPRFSYRLYSKRPKPTENERSSDRIRIKYN